MECSRVRVGSRQRAGATRGGCLSVPQTKLKPEPRRRNEHCREDRIPGCPQHPLPRSVPRHLGQEIPPDRQRRHADRPQHGRHLQACRPRARRRRAGSGARALVRAVPVGAAPRRDPGGPRHLERRRAGAQAGDVHDQLHGVRHHPRLDGRHPGQGPRGGPHAQGGLRHRLRVFHAAPARRVRVGRRCLHVGPAVVHGYLRQDVFHGIVGRRPPRRADGHVRRRPPGRHGIHPRQARGRAPAAVQPVAARHGRVHEGRARGPRLAARLPGDGGRGRRTRHQRPREVRLARMADAQRLRRATTRAWCSARSTRPCPRSACGT